MFEKEKIGLNEFNKLINNGEENMFYVALPENRQIEKNMVSSILEVNV